MAKCSLHRHITELLGVKTAATASLFTELHGIGLSAINRTRNVNYVRHATLMQFSRKTYCKVCS